VKASNSGNQKPSWTRHLFYRSEAIRTTWKLRLSLLLFAIVVIPATHRIWAPAIGNSLVCSEQILPSDAFLVENFDADYLVFEHTRTLQASGVAVKAYVPVLKDEKHGGLNVVLKGTAELMARVAWLESMEFIPIDEREPISLNAAMQIRDVLAGQKVKSVIVVTPGFRSRRSMMVYDSVLAPAGITVRCSPVFGQKTADNWTQTWHGIQEVLQQFIKLQYYRFWVLW
jgi:hypothetical protein